MLCQLGQGCKGNPGPEAQLLGVTQSLLWPWHLCWAHLAGLQFPCLCPALGVVLVGVPEATAVPSTASLVQKEGGE